MNIDKHILLTENAMEVLRRRYLTRNEREEIVETPAELFSRVAKFIAEADRIYGADDEQVDKTAQKFFDLMANLEFMPNSPTLMNAGKELGQLSACFVLPVGDSMEEIFETNKNAAMIHKSGGGTGFSFSKLRPKGSIVRSTHGVASGPVSFMKVYNASTEAVKQGGTRRGANMGILRVDHPDILDFISSKDDTREVTNFNISVAVTDTFMEAVRKKKKYSLLDPRSGKEFVKDGKKVEIDANEVFDAIVEHAWNTGEPGIVYIDRMNQRNPTYPFETIEATNPCGEQPLPPYDSCNLGSVNLGKFVFEKLPDDFVKDSPEKGINWDAFGAAVRTGVHFLDNVIDQNKYPLKEIEVQTKLNRRIGLGVMGWADMLVKLGLPYNSKQAFALADKVMSFVESEATKQSSELAKSRGKFTNWQNSKYKSDNVSMRNATVTTIAPTGTISIIAGCSSGIEPYYSIVFERNVMDGTVLKEVNPLFERVAREQEFFSSELVEEVASKRSLADVESVPEKVKSIFLTSIVIHQYPKR
jgi:ribonucleoside-diphosphate reductase alpha chain